MLPCNQGNNQNLRIVINALYKFFLSYDKFCKKTMFTIGLSKTITSHNIWISNDISKGEVLILIPTKKQEESVDTWKTKRKKERKKKEHHCISFQTYQPSSRWNANWYGQDGSRSTECISFEMISACACRIMTCDKETKGVLKLSLYRMRHCIWRPRSWHRKKQCKQYKHIENFQRGIKHLQFL